VILTREEFMIKSELLRDLNREKNREEVVVAATMETLYRLKTSFITSSMAMIYLEAGSVRGPGSINNSIITSTDRRSLIFNNYSGSLVQ